MKRPAAGVIFLLLLLAGLLPAAFIPWNQVLETRVLALLPETARSDDARLAREFMEGTANRVLLGILAHPEQHPLEPDAVETFEEVLRRNPAIERVESPSGDVLREPGAVLFDHRFSWLLPGWLDEHFPGWETNPPGAESMVARVVEEMDAFLEDPGSHHAGDILPHDPFLLVPRQLDRFPVRTPSPSSARKLYWITQKDSPLEASGQEPVFEALAKARDHAREQQPGLRFDYTGVGAFAEASRTRIQMEVTRLNTLTFLFVVGVLGFFLRRPRLVLPLAGLLALSIASALYVTLAVFSSVHILTLVIGSILVGVAIDYGLHIFLHKPSSGSRNTLLRPLFTGAVSTAGGFAFLLFSELPLLNQVGTFTVTGLLAALLFGLLLKRLFPDSVAVPYLTPRFRPFSLVPGYAALPLVLLAAAAAFLVSWHDDIRELDYPHPELQERDREIRGLFDSQASGNAYFVLGSTPSEARENLQAWLAGTPDRDAEHLGAILPVPSRSESAWRLFQPAGFLPALRQALDHAEFELEAFSPFEEDWKEFLETQPTERLYNRQLEAFSDALPLPLSMLLQVKPDLTWFLVRRTGDSDSIDKLPSFVRPVQQLETLNASFALYRESSTRLILTGCALLGLIVLLAYRRQALSCVYPPLLAAAATLGAAALVFEHLNLFHLIGLFLGTCIALDYALFATEQRLAGGNLPASVPLSALTTFGVFSILATSAIGAVQALGFSVACTILFGFFLTLVRPLR